MLPSSPTKRICWVQSLNCDVCLSSCFDFVVIVWTLASSVNVVVEPWTFESPFLTMTFRVISLSSSSFWALNLCSSLFGTLNLCITCVWTLTFSINWQHAPRRQTGKPRQLVMARAPFEARWNHCLTTYCNKNFRGWIAGFNPFCQLIEIRTLRYPGILAAGSYSTLMGINIPNIDF